MSDMTSTHSQEGKVPPTSVVPTSYHGQHRSAIITNAPAHLQAFFNTFSTFSSHGTKCTLVSAHAAAHLISVPANQISEACRRPSAILQVPVRLTLQMNYINHPAKARHVISLTFWLAPFNYYHPLYDSRY